MIVFASTIWSVSVYVATVLGFTICGGSGHALQKWAFYAGEKTGCQCQTLFAYVPARNDKHTRILMVPESNLNKHTRILMVPEFNLNKHTRILMVPEFNLNKHTRILMVPEQETHQDIDGSRIQP